MKNTYRSWFFAFLTIFLMVGFTFFTQQHSSAATGTNKRINFQGKVVNNDGTNVANGSYTFAFNIYTVSSAGSAVWTESKSLTVIDGIFQTDLGDTTTLPGSIDFNTDNIYLGITFNGDGEMSPRVRFDAVPQAFNAQKVAGLTVTDTTGTLTIPSGKTISFADAFTTSGAFATTLTSTAATNVTLPTTGTLLTGTATANQTITSTQTSGTVAGITDSTAIIGATTGLAVTLSGTGAFDQTGLAFNLTNASGTNLNDILGSGSTWKVSRAGAGTFASVTSPTFTSSAGLTINSGNNTLTVDATDTALTASGVTTVTLAANASIVNSAGDLTLQPSGSGTMGVVHIGNGGSGSTTMDFLGLDVKSTTGDPAFGGFEGAMYYNTFDNKFRCFEGAAWKDCDTSSAGGGYATIADEGVDLTQRTKLNFIGSGVSCVDNSGSSRTDCTISSAGGGVSFASGTPDNTTGTNNLIQLQKNGSDKFVVANNGGVSVFGATTNITKTNTGTTGANDFSITGSTLTNVTSQNDEIDIDNGSVTTTFTSAAAATAVAVGAGGQSIVRDDGKVLVVHGGAALTGSLWDGTSGTMASVTIASGATAPGAGAISIKRPNGRYLLVHGNASAGLTSLFDPWGVTAAAAGPAVCGGGAATTGTNAFMRGDGKYVILCGGLTAWGIYDPTANTYVAGTAVTLAFGAGAHAIARDDGTFLVFRGGNTTDHWLYTPSGTAATAGVMSTINPITTNAPTVNTGAFSIRRNDGKYLVVGGAINTSTIYNPTATGSNSGAGSFELVNGGVAAAGYGPITTALGDAAQAVRRQDGKYLMVHGGASTLTDIIDPSVTTSSMFTAGTALNNAMGAGGHFVPRPDGKYAIVRGGASTAVDTYDMGFIMGGTGSGSQLASYETECITVTSLNQSSTLNWNANTEGSLTFQVKTGAGSCSGSYKNIANSGDLIRPTAGDNRVQVKVFFKRPFFQGYDQEWSLWRGLSQPRYRAKIADPTLYDITIDNSTQLHRTQFDLGIGTNSSATDPSGPVASNINILADKSAQLATMVGSQNASTTINATNPQFYNGAFGTHTALTTSATAGTIVMKRPNGTFMVISGNTATANAQIYDQNAQTFTANANGVSGSTCSGNCTPTAGTGLGALAFKRPDGKFLVVIGNATTTTNIYDPVASTFTAGPALTAASGRGALTIPLPTGRVLILHGNFTATSSVYDPIQNVMVSGPAPSAVIGGGAMAIPRPDGTYFVVLGIATEACTALNTTTNNFNPYTMAFTATGSPAITTGVGPGAFAFQRSDGQWVIVHGGGTITTCAATNRTQIYNPITNQSVVRPPLSVAAAQHGAHAVQRPNGTWLVVHGGGATTTSIYLEKTGAFTANGLSTIGQFVAGPALTTAASAGSISFQRDDGKYVMITGNAGTVVQQYDAGWVNSGAYRTEQLNVSDLSADSTLSWKASPDMKNISAEVRTATSQLGLQTASSRDVTSSGGLINPGGSDTWVQIQFNFKRTFPTHSSIWNDVWWNGGSVINFNLRDIANPTLNEFKVNKDVNLMNLKADGLSVFRVSTNGDVYLSANGAVRSGGADLAENYTSSTPLEAGEVVAIDSTNNHGVKRSQYQYQKDMLGVVSTAPGFVAGSQTENSYPIALVGRVPVKVSTENGSVKVGDHLTAASVPGYAMRATKAGRVLGVALESLDDTKLHACPASEFASPGRKCGEVMMFVNLVNYMGDSVQVAMEERAQEKQLSGGGIDGLSTGDSMTDNVATSGLENAGGTMNILTATGEGEQFSKQQEILGFLNDLKAEQAKSSQYSSEIFTDQLYATNGIVTPQLVADLIIAKKIKADSIEGLEVFTDKIGSLSDRVANQGKDVTTQSLTAEDAEIGSLAIESAKISMNMSVDGKLTVNGLIVNDKAVFKNDTVFNKLVSFIGKVVFKSDVAFEKTPVFNKDTAGFAKIAKGADRVEIAFDKAYDKTPIVQAMMAFDEETDSAVPAPSTNSSVESAALPAQDGSVATAPIMPSVAGANTTSALDAQKRIVAQGYSYFVVDRTKKGFTIILNKPADEDLNFSWVAIAVADARTFESKKPEPIIGTSSAIPTTTTTETPTTTSTSAPTTTTSTIAPAF